MMNKLGFYTQSFQYLAEPVGRIQPPVMLAEMYDRGFLRDMRNFRSPNTFVVGRYFIENQRQKLYDNPNSDPEQAGHDLAEFIIRDDFEFAKQRGNNGRLIVDAWMTLNELLPGPASDNWQREEERKKIIEDAEAYDAYQVAFLKRLRQDGLEAVAFNFAAGNWTRGEDYLKYFPKTLQNYTYLGFHEYGWPHMDPSRPDTKSGCGVYRDVMKVINEEYGYKHKVMITEAGLALMYKHPHHRAEDVGWLYRNNPEWGPEYQVEEVSEDSYKASMEWYNQFLQRDEYVLGACLFMVGVGSAKWETFAHIRDAQGNTFTLMDKIYELSQAPTPVPHLLAVPITHRRLALREPALQGDDVREVQERLAFLGYLSADHINGIYDENTHTAVWEFQETNLLIPDGIVGTQTRLGVFSNEALPRRPQARLARLKVGLDLNAPLNPATGEAWGPVADPAILATSEAHWTRLNFILGPGHHPHHSVSHSGQAWLDVYHKLCEGLTNAWGEHGPQFYAVIGSEAAHRDPGNLFRFPPVEEGWALSRRVNTPQNRPIVAQYNQEQIAMMGETPDEWIERYAEHFEMIVEAFQNQIQVFEAFNEPNDWHVVPEPLSERRDPVTGEDWQQEHVAPYWLAKMIERIYQRVKDYDIKIITGPLLGFGKNWPVTAKYLNDVYKAGQRLFGWGNGRGYPFDGVGYHLYAHPDFRPNEGPLETFVQRTYREHVNQIEHVIKQYEGPGSNKQLYISEFGWPTPSPNSESDQAIQDRALRAGFDALKDDPRVALAIWFCTCDFPGDLPYGLYKEGTPGSGTAKQALETFRTYARYGGFIVPH